MQSAVSVCGSRETTSAASVGSGPCSPTPPPTSTVPSTTVAPVVIAGNATGMLASRAPVAAS
jgi:hypothetical protein